MKDSSSLSTRLFQPQASLVYFVGPSAGAAAAIGVFKFLNTETQLPKTARPSRYKK